MGGTVSSIVKTIDKATGGLLGVNAADKAAQAAQAQAAQAAAVQEAKIAEQEAMIADKQRKQKEVTAERSARASSNQLLTSGSDVGAKSNNLLGVK